MTARDELIAEYKKDGKWDELPAEERRRIQSLDEVAAKTELEWALKLGAEMQRLDDDAANPPARLPSEPPAQTLDDAD